MKTNSVHIDQDCEVSPDGIQLEKLKAGKTYNLTPHATEIILKEKWGHLTRDTDSPEKREAKVDAPEDTPRMSARVRR